MRVPIIAGNWKMNNTVPEAVTLVRELLASKIDNQVTEVVVCPPFTALYPVGQQIAGSKVILGAQNLFYETKGAYTGEISPTMLVDLGVRYVIVGHSERRAYQKESDSEIAKKLEATFKSGLNPILCVGESLAEREAGREKEVVKGQLEADLKLVTADQAGQLVIAYEPIWAIGTGRSAQPADATAMAQTIRDLVTAKFGADAASAVRILYGGSVNATNSSEFLSQEGIDGALVGGASLKAKDFSAIVKSASR
ncbi:MAG: triose-phosphate isomerase [bacterium]|jgi:triosephosphate isomerase